MWNVSFAYMCVGCKGLYHIRSTQVYTYYIRTHVILLAIYVYSEIISHSSVTIDTTRPASRTTGSFFIAASNSPARPAIWSMCFCCRPL